MTARPTDRHVGLVVEGRGDLYALPVLLRRWLQRRGDWRDVIGKPVPCHGRDKALAPSGVEGYVATAASRPGCIGVVVVLDAETDPACRLGPNLRARAMGITSKRVAVCLAENKYEAWLIASAETLSIEGLVYDPARDPESLLRAALPVKYVKPTWQPRLSERVDFNVACSRSPSFARMLAKFDELVAEIA